MKVKQNDEEYNKYVEIVTPKHSLPKNCINAFIVGGIICTLGQLIHDIAIKYFHCSEEDANSWTPIILCP